MVWLRALFVIAVVVAQGCRFGFDPHDAVVDGQGLHDDGSSSDAQIMQPPQCGSAARQLVVTTAVDESDIGESAQSPHQGSGLSLREAIIISNGAPQRQCIVFAEPMTVSVVAGDLPGLAAGQGAVIDGGRAVTLTGTGIGLLSMSATNEIRSISLVGFDVGISAQSSSTRVIDVRVSGSRIGIQFDGANNQLERSRLSGCSSQGLHIKDGSVGTVVLTTIFHDNSGQALKVGSGTGTVIRHTTMHGNAADAVKAEANATGITLENCIFTNNGAAIRAQQNGSFLTIDHVQLFGNTDSDCANCSFGSTVLVSDPLFMGAAAGDFRLGPGSAAIDAGADRGVDVNGDTPGAFNGGAPDLGALESP